MKFWASTNHNGWLRGLFRGSSEDVPQRYNMICGVAGVSWPLAGVVCSSSVVLCVFVCVVWGCFGLAGFLASVPPLVLRGEFYRTAPYLKVKNHGSFRFRVSLQPELRSCGTLQTPSPLLAARERAVASMRRNQGHGWMMVH